MTKDTSQIVLEADLQMLANAAGRLHHRMRAWPTAYIAGCISIATVLVACANLATKTDGKNLFSLYEDNKHFLAIVGLFVYAIGVVQLASFARDRKHYVRILNCLNDLRKRSSEQLGIEETMRRFGLTTSLSCGRRTVLQRFRLFCLSAVQCCC